MQYIFWYDWVLTLILIGVTGIWARYFVQQHSEQSLIQQYFRKGLFIKILASIAFACYHAYIYGGGDTFGYYTLAKDIVQHSKNHYGQLLNIVFQPVEWNYDYLNSISSGPDDLYIRSESNFFQVRLATLLLLFTFKSYLATGVLFSLISYWGIWKGFVAFDKIFPGQQNLLAISFLFFPTVVFWGSGLGKDSLALGAICAFMAAVISVFITKEKRGRNALLILLMGCALLIIKSYIILALIPALSISLALLYIKNRKRTISKILLTPVVLLALYFAGFFFVEYVNRNFEDFSAENLADRIVTSNLNLQADAGSAFDLGIRPENIGGLSDLAAFFPKAVVASCFRPWIWEAKNPAMLLSAMEGFFLLIVGIVLLIKGKIFKTIQIIFSDPLLICFLLYGFVFLGLVGLSTSNFGTLVRYKLPCMPFVLMLFLITYKRLSKNKPHEQLD